MARAAFAASLERLVAQDAALRLHANEDAVHDARVAVRRLRCDLRTFMPLLDAAWASDLRERVRGVQDGFAEARDADVLLARLRRHAEQLSAGDRTRAGAILARCGAERDRAYERMRAMLNEARYAALLDELAEAVRRPRASALAEEPARDVLPPIVLRAWSALRKHVRRRSRPPSDAELHRIRIAAKRVRYAAEAVAPVAGRRARALARAAEAIQTVLGDQHDAVVASVWLRRSPDGAESFVAGELAMIERRNAAHGRRAWRKAWRDAKRAHRALRRAW